MDKKYKLTQENIDFLGRTLYRIEALKDFDKVKKGDMGGYVESEKNLSQEGNCWIYDNAVVFDSAYVCGDAKVCDNAQVFGDARVYDNARVFGNAEVWNNALVDDNALVYDNAKVFGNAQVYSDAQIFGNAEVADYVEIGDNAIICDNAQVFGNAIVFGNARICGKAIVSGNAEIKNSSDYIVFKNWWSSGRYFTWTRTNNMWKVGCFYGTGDELIKKAYEDSEISGREYKRVVDYVESIIKQ